MLVAVAWWLPEAVTGCFICAKWPLIMRPLSSALWVDIHQNTAANAENPSLGGRIQGLTRLGVSFSILSMLVNPWITNSSHSTVLEELCLLVPLFFPALSV